MAGALAATRFRVTLPLWEPFVHFSVRKP